MDAGVEYLTYLACLSGNQIKNEQNENNDQQQWFYESRG
jgi:hypothetical protein